MLSSALSIKRAGLCCCDQSLGARLVGLACVAVISLLEARLNGLACVAVINLSELG